MACQCTSRICKPLCAEPIVQAAPEAHHILRVPRWLARHELSAVGAGRDHLNRVRQKPLPDRHKFVRDRLETLLRNNAAEERGEWRKQAAGRENKLRQQRLGLENK